MCPQTPGPRTSTSLWTVRTGTHSRRWAAQKSASEASSHNTAWAPPPVRSAVALESHRSANPTVNCTCEGSRSHVPYENLKPDDLRWGWDGDASTVKWSEVAQSCLTLCNPMDCSLPGSSLHGILQARILQWVAISFRGSSWLRDRTWVSCSAGRRFNLWATREALSDCKYRLPLAKRFGCTEAIINQMLADSYQNPTREWQVTFKLHLVAGLTAESELLHFNCTAACGWQTLSKNPTLISVHVWPTH